jgi:tetratricopeptide (TPR) repeat protein
MAIQTDPNRREPFVDMANLAYNNSDWGQCYIYSKSALAITTKPLDYLCENFAWGTLPYDLASISAYHLGKYDEAVDFGKAALRLDPENSRLAQNLKLYASLI